MLIFGFSLTALVYFLIFNKLIRIIYKKASAKKYIQLNILFAITLFVVASINDFANLSRIFSESISDSIEYFLGSLSHYIKIPIAFVIIFSPLLFITVSVVFIMIFFKRNLTLLINICRSPSSIDVRYNINQSKYATLAMALASILYFYYFGHFSLIAFFVNSILFASILSIAIFFPANDSLPRILVQILAMLSMVMINRTLTLNESRLDYHMNLTFPIFWVSSAYGFYLNRKIK